MVVFSLQGAGARLPGLLRQAQDKERLQEIDKIDKKSSHDRLEQREEHLGREIETYKKNIAVLEKKRSQLFSHLDEKDAQLKKWRLC